MEKCNYGFFFSVFFSLALLFLSFFSFCLFVLPTTIEALLYTTVLDMQSPHLFDSVAEFANVILLTL